MVEGVRADKQNERQLGRSLPLINQPAAQLSGYAGAGTSVAVIDSGVDYLHPSFGCTGVNLPTTTCRVRFSTDLAPNDGLRDDAGKHGTNVSAIVLGVAPQTKVLGLDVFQDGAADSTILTALNWVISNRATYNIVAANLSLGDTSWHTSQCTSVYTSPFANLRSAGIVPVVSAGNDAAELGYFQNGLSEPACAPGALSVGAVYDSNIGSFACDSTTNPDKVTCFSQSATYLSLLAPGVGVTAGGVTKTGTSMAAPHVAGAVAVLASANSSSTVSQREMALKSAGPSILDTRNGVTKHRLDVCGALQSVSRTCSPGANNDNRANATLIGTNRALLSHSTYGFTTEASDPLLSCGYTGTRQSASAWYKFTTSSSGTLSASTIGSDVPSLASMVDDTVMALFEVSGGSLIELACSDDVGGGLYASQFSRALQAGKSYYLEVTGWGSLGSLGGYVILNVSYTGSLSPGGATKLGFTATPNGGMASVPFPVQPKVAAQDASGVTVTTDIVRSVVLSKYSGPGTLSCSGGLTKNTVNGVATFSGCSVSAPGVYRLRADASGLASATTVSFTIDGATKLGFIATPTGGVAEVPFAIQPQVAAQNSSGATVTTDIVRSVVLSKYSGPGTLSCTGGLTKSTVNGVATFSGCSVSAPGVYQLRATASGLTAATSTTFTIDAIPRIDWVDPLAVVVGDGGFTLNVHGANFVSGAVIRFNGVDRSTTFVDGTHLSTAVTAEEITTTGPIMVTVVTPAGTSNEVVFLVYDTWSTLPSLSRN